ncbi:hypothetical protein BJ912DRAFT_1042672 [Pholiota molesta]|nr:hypothetical protein BJ912DRAFT_1042672 [Pholiota molesta]
MYDRHDHYFYSVGSILDIDKIPDNPRSYKRNKTDQSKASAENTRSNEENARRASSIRASDIASSPVDMRIESLRRSKSLTCGEERCEREQAEVDWGFDRRVAATSHSRQVPNLSARGIKLQEERQTSGAPMVYAYFQTPTDGTAPGRGRTLSLGRYWATKEAALAGSCRCVEQRAPPVIALLVVFRGDAVLLRGIGQLMTSSMALVASSTSSVSGIIRVLAWVTSHMEVRERGREDLLFCSQALSAQVMAGGSSMYTYAQAPGSGAAAGYGQTNFIALSSKGEKARWVPDFSLSPFRYLSSGDLHGLPPRMYLSEPTALFRSDYTPPNFFFSRRLVFVPSDALLADDDASSLGPAVAQTIDGSSPENSKSHSKSSAKSEQEELLATQAVEEARGCSERCWKKEVKPCFGSSGIFCDELMTGDADNELCRSQQRRELPFVPRNGFPNLQAGLIPAATAPRKRRAQCAHASYPTLARQRILITSHPLHSPGHPPSSRSAYHTCASCAVFLPAFACLFTARVCNVTPGIPFLFTVEPTYDNGQPSCWRVKLRLPQPSKYVAQCSLAAARSVSMGCVECVPPEKAKRRNEPQCFTSQIGWAAPDYTRPSFWGARRGTRLALRICAWGWYSSHSRGECYKGAPECWRRRRRRCTHVRSRGVQWGGRGRQLAIRTPCCPRFFFDFSGHVRVRGALASSSAYAYEGKAGDGPMWASAYAENFKVGDLGVGASAGGMGGYGRFVALPPLPIVGMPGVGIFAIRAGGAVHILYLRICERGGWMMMSYGCRMWMCTGAIRVCV